MYKDFKIPSGFDFTRSNATGAAGKKQPAKKPFKNMRKDLKEGIGISADIMAPAMLILKRRGIRVYPDGQRVALYHNDRFNMIFPVPFGPSRLNISNPSAPISGFTK